MNFLIFKALDSLFSFKKELTYLLLTFLLVLSIPIIAVILLTHAGFDEVSDRLAEFDVNSNKVILYYPNGSVYKELSLNVTWPFRGVVTLEFGESHWPFQPYHSGIDIASSNGRVGDPITVFMPGKVIYEGQIFWGFGKHVVIDNGDNISSIYAHLDKINVKKNQEVKPGDVIGTEGSTGWSTGPHLHFQVNVFGIPVNPRVFLGK